MSFKKSSPNGCGLISRPLLDLSQPLRPGAPPNPTQPEVEYHCLSSLSAGDPLTTGALRLPLHAGTHLDAPSHIVVGGAAITDIELDRFDRPTLVVDARRPGGDLITTEDVRQAGEPLLEGDSVFFYTGRGELFDQPDYADFPSLSLALAEYLVEAGVGLVGTDALSPDMPLPRRGPDFDFEIHRALLGAGVLIAENLCQLGPIAGRKVRVRAFPLPVAGGDGAPARVIAEL